MTSNHPTREISSNFNIIHIFQILQFSCNVSEVRSDEDNNSVVNSSPGTKQLIIQLVPSYLMVSVNLPSNPRDDEYEAAVDSLLGLGTAMLR